MSYRNNKAKKTFGTVSAKSSITSTHKYNLRTILKGRGSQRDLLIQNSKQISVVSRNQSQLSNRIQSRVSASLNLADSRLSENNSLNQSNIKTIDNKLQTLNCEEQLICKPEPKNEYNEFMRKLEELDKEAEVLIQNKIHKIAKKSNSITLKDKGKDQISIQIQHLIHKITNLKSQHLQKFNINQQQMKNFVDRKINLLEKFLAETSTESEVLKKYFFAINTINYQNKTSFQFNKSNNSIKNALRPIYIRPYRTKTEEKQSIYKQSVSHQLYHPPRLDQYETYRYKSKDYTINVQPIPRSSYKCQYLHYSPRKPEMKCKVLDNTLFGKTTLHQSTYSKDYQEVKAKYINYKDFESYKNKLKNIQVSYAADNANRREEKEEYIQKSKNYIAEQVKMKYNSKNIKSMVNRVNEYPSFHQNLVKTQAKREFKEYQQIYSSMMKNKHLNNLKYFYRNLIND